VRLRLLRLEEELKEVVGGTRVVARIAGFPTAFIDLIPTVVRRLRNQIPRAEITLEHCGHEDAIGRLRRGDVDIALVFRDPQAERGDADLRVIDLGAQPMHALLPREHSLRSTKAIKLRSLRNERWIVGSVDEPSSIIVAACRAAGFEPQIAFTTDDALATQGLVAAGLGVSLSSPWEASVLRSDVVLRPVTQPSPKRRIAAMVAQPAAPAAELLLDLTRSCVRELAQRRVAIAR
jgi:DNA-binding transcriptional LysR family regulator